jgi:hypothetical protein
LEVGKNDADARLDGRNAECGDQAGLFVGLIGWSALDGVVIEIESDSVVESEGLL